MLEMPIWVAIASPVGGIIIGAYLAYLFTKRISTRRENFDREVIQNKQEEDRKMAKWQQEADNARATIGSVRRPGGKEAPPMPPRTELKASPNGWFRKLFRRKQNN